MRPLRIRSRLAVLLIAAALVGAPALVLRALCVGKSCEEAESTASEIPFCSLPDGVRDAIAAGFEGDLHRSPDLLAVAGDVPVAGGTVYRGDGPPWPSVKAPGAPRVPLVFWGAGIDAEAEVPASTDLADVAPSLAETVGFRRPNPQVRAGEAVAGIASGDAPRLVLLVALKGVGSEDVEAAPGRWANLRRMLEQGAGTLDATTGSLPADPAATLTTLGTGGLPSEHGITATVVRNDGGEIVRAWGPRSPIHIIATLADDLDEARGQKPKIGLVRSAVEDGGLIGGKWYVDVDKDDVVTARLAPTDEVRAMLKRGFGDDDVADLMAVALGGSGKEIDRELDAVVAAAQDASGGDLAVAVAGTGRDVSSEIDIDRFVDSLERAIPGPVEVVEEVVAGGIYLDQEALVDAGISDDEVLRALQGLKADRGTPLFADAFAGIAVSFARYC